MMNVMFKQQDAHVRALHEHVRVFLIFKFDDQAVNKVPMITFENYVHCLSLEILLHENTMPVTQPICTRSSHACRGTSPDVEARNATGFLP